MNQEVATIEQKPLTVIERASKALSKADVETKIRELIEQSRSITTVTDSASREVCHSSLMVLKNMRIQTQNAAKEGRDEAVKYSKAVIAIEKELVGLISPEEDRLAAIRDEWDSAKEREKEARIVAELARVAEIQRRIDAIRAWAVNAATQPSMLVGQMLQSANDFTIDPATFEEFTQNATDALMVSRAALTGLLAQRKEHEAEQQRILDERAELAKLKAEAAERAKIAAEEQAQRERTAEIERQRVEAEAKQKREVEDAAAKAAREIEAARIAEANRIEAEAQEANRLRNEMAMQELQAIHHQLIIADIGRKPYCKGGDLQTYDWLLEQTEKWPITEEKFGALFDSAKRTKETVLASLRQKRSDLVARMEQEALDKIAREQLAADKAAQEAEGEAQRKTLADQTAALAAQREALEREHQEIARKAAESKPEPLKASARTVDRPSAAQLIQCVAERYKVSATMAEKWLRNIKWESVAA